MKKLGLIKEIIRNSNEKTINQDDSFIELYLMSSEQDKEFIRKVIRDLAVNSTKESNNHIH